MMGSKDENTIGIGKSYLEKFIQLPIFLPTLENAKLKSLINKESSKLFKDNELSVEEKDIVVENILKSRLTVRNIHRYLTTISFLKSFLNEEVNLKDLLLLTLLKIANYKLFKFISNNPIYFIEELNEKTKKDREKEISNFAQEFSEYEDILITLSPFSAQLFNRTISEISREVIKREKRMADPKYFQKYFIYGVPEGDISVAEFNVFLDNLSTKNTDELESEYEILIRRHAEADINTLILINIINIKHDAFIKLVNLLCRFYKKSNQLFIIQIIVKGIKIFNNKEIFMSDLFKLDNMNLAFMVYSYLDSQSEFDKSFERKLEETYSNHITSNLVNDNTITELERKTIEESWIGIKDKDDNKDHIRKDLQELIRTPQDLERIIGYIYERYKQTSLADAYDPMITEYAFLLEYINRELIYQLSEQYEDIDNYFYISKFKKLDTEVYSILTDHFEEIYNKNNREKVNYNEIKNFRTHKQLFLIIYERGNRTLIEKWESFVEFPLEK